MKSHGTGTGRSIRLVAALLAGALAAACAAPKRGALPSTDVDEDGFREAVATLSAPDYAGRRPGTAGEDKTVAYLVAQFRQLKLKPGNGDSYVQAVPMVEWTPVAAPSLAVAAGGRRREYAYGAEMLVWPAAGEADAELRDSELVFAGYGIVAPEYGHDDYGALDLQGRTVLVLAGEPGLRGAGSTSRYARVSYKVEEAARHGAGAVLVIHEAATVGYGWDALSGRLRGSQFTRQPSDSLPASVRMLGWVTEQAASTLFRDAGMDYVATRASAAQPGFRTRALELRVTAAAHGIVRHFTSANVVAVLPGSQRRGEYLVYSAHWDHLGLTDTAPAGTLRPGAVDNASGVAGLLQLARSFGRTYPVPARSIVFLASTGGEADQAGAAFYCDNPLFALQDTVAELNLDTLRIGGPTRDVQIFGRGQSELDGYVRDAATLQGRELHAEMHPERARFYNSDSFSFAAHGVPVIYAMGGADDSARGPKWGEEQLNEFFERRYLRPADVYSPDWDVRGTLDDLRLYYRVGMQLAQSGRFPNWYHNSEFRSTQSPARGG